MVINFDIFYFGKQTVKQHMKVKVAQLCPTLCDPMDYTVHGILQVRILEWVAFPSLGIFPNQGLNPGLPHCRGILYQLSHRKNPRILEWVAYPFSSRSSQSQELNWGFLHCRQILYQLAIRETPKQHIKWSNLEKKESFKCRLFCRLFCNSKTCNQWLYLFSNIWHCFFIELIFSS